MIVPFSKGQKGQAPAQAQPSETDMLMALATMHQMGRIGKVLGSKGKAPDTDPLEGAPVA